MATGPSRRAARLGVTIITVAMPPGAPPAGPHAAVAAARNLRATLADRLPTTTSTARRRVLTALTAVLLGVGLVAGCGGEGAPGGAALPARSGAGGTGDPAPGGTSAPPSPDVSAPAAIRTVEAYFQEINDAIRAGRLAVLGPTSLDGCQACALDVGVSRSLQQRGLHADGPAYQLGDVTARPRAGLAATVTFTLRTATVGLLDAAGRHVTDAPGVATRAATAQLALTAQGFRIQTLRYATAPA
ncbi:hypothetical protein [Frankia sp. AiPa1]|uniref:hypothetical protein n=1 Tax=Frankia sp. AiPa1 TaxID=573492 RepID=UPI00202B16C4|nr:hypothetical protein [Frankia sp. AiPa1]MCL9759605.1 hypothetical protein [Frankia sp. AiPa1]